MEGEEESSGTGQEGEEEDEENFLVPMAQHHDHPPNAMSL